MTGTGGELLLELLESYGVEHIFCSPGTEWAPVWEALAKKEAQGNSALKYVNCRHEMLAVSVATGYAACTGKLPAVLLHSGIGTLHGSMALRNAYFAKVPMIVFSGETYEHSGDEEVRPQGWHWLELLSDIGGPSSFVKGYVKWSNSIKSKDSLVDLVSRGCQMARTTPQGPVFLSVTLETLIRSYSECRIPQPCRNDAICAPSPACVDEAAERLSRSRKPVIISEYAGRNPGAVDKLVELSDMLSIPVFEGAYPVYSNFPRSNPLYMGFESADVLQDADTILVVGGSAPWYPPLSCKADVKVILLDDDPLHANLPHWGYPVDLTLSTDFELGLSSLMDAVRSRIASSEHTRSERYQYWKVRHDRLTAGWEEDARLEEKNVPISPKWFLREARRIFPENAMILDETITHMRTVHQYMSQPGHYMKSGYGCLGVGIGEAIGAKMAHPDRPVILLVGDGAFFYNPTLAGLGLCQEYGVPITIAVMNNGGYMGMKRAHQGLYPDGYAVAGKTYLGIDITPAPDYAALAGVFDGYGAKLENPGDVETTLIRGLHEMEKGRMVLLDVVL
jgi:acetolactate synthase I/II/III large subunit